MSFHIRAGCRGKSAFPKFFYNLAHSPGYSHDDWNSRPTKDLKGFGTAVAGEDRHRLVAGNQGSGLDPGALGGLEVLPVFQRFIIHRLRIYQRK